MVYGSTDVASRRLWTLGCIYLSLWSIGFSLILLYTWSLYSCNSIIIALGKHYQFTLIDYASVFCVLSYVFNFLSQIPFNVKILYDIFDYTLSPLSRNQFCLLAVPIYVVCHTHSIVCDFMHVCVCVLTLLSKSMVLIVGDTLWETWYIYSVHVLYCCVCIHRVPVCFWWFIYLVI